MTITMPATAAMTAEERVQFGRRISEGIDPAQRSATSKQVHAARRARAEEVA